MIGALQCQYPHVYLMIHGDTAARKGVPCSICTFPNDAATIQIFIKGLKNGHSLATHIYEKGPKMLSDTISKSRSLMPCKD